MVHMLIATMQTVRILFEVDVMLKSINELINQPIKQLQAFKAITIFGDTELATLWILKMKNGAHYVVLLVN